MATLSYSPTTSGTDLAYVWKKIQGPLIRGFNASCEEWRLLKDLPDAKLIHSAREVTSPIDITPETAGASIPEGGKESNPITTAPQELTFTWVNLNKRFSKSLLAKYLASRSSAGELEDQMKHQGRKLMEGLTNYVGRQFYGFSTGYVCQTSTNVTASSGQAYTLEDAYGVAGIDNAAFLAGHFQINDRVALIRSGALVANAIGTITAKSAATPSITVTWLGSVDADADDYVVYANSVENTTIAGTDYNRWMVGLLDGTTSTSVHGLSGSTYPLWTSYQDATGGRFDLGKLRAGQYAIQNNGGGKSNLLIVSNGVMTDMTLQTQASLRFDDALNMEFDGATKVKGHRIFTSRKVPPGYAFLMDDRKAVFKWNLLPMPDADGNYPEGAEYTNVDKLQDTSAEVFSLDQSIAMVWKNRACAAVYSGLTEA